MQGAKKFYRAAYRWICKQEIFSQRSSWDEVWIFRGALNWMLPHALTLAVAAIKQAGGFVS